MLIENDKMLLKNEEVAKEFNQYFGHITDSLDLFAGLRAPIKGALMQI